MSFSDVIKKSVLEGFSYTDISTSKIIVTLAITFLISVYIFFVYKYISKSSFYFKSFNVSMAIISVVTAGIILAMQSSIVISLGMVGALSIVRFRTAIKDPMDLLFLFWSIGTGIICGAGLYKIAILLAILVTIGILLLDMIPLRKSPFILIINTDSDAMEQIDTILKNHARFYKIKSHNIKKNAEDIIIELRTDDGNVLVKEIAAIPAVTNVSLVQQDGEVHT